MIYDITHAITSLRPNSNWIIQNENYNTLNWFETNEEPKPTLKEIKDEIKRLQSEYDRTAYQRQRQPEYPTIGDQLDALFHAGVFPPEMAAQIQAVKDKYPKGE